jgi:hypothetical protein
MDNNTITKQRIINYVGDKSMSIILKIIKFLLNCSLHRIYYYLNCRNYYFKFFLNKYDF